MRPATAARGLRIATTQRPAVQAPAVSGELPNRHHHRKKLSGGYSGPMRRATRSPAARKSQPAQRRLRPHVRLAAPSAATTTAAGASHIRWGGGTVRSGGPRPGWKRNWIATYGVATHTASTIVPTMATAAG